MLIARSIHPEVMSGCQRGSMSFSRDKKPVFRPLTDKTFRFRCHRAISCFTSCCADLKLMLTPYDVLRIKNRLGLSSQAFLEEYTVTTYDPSERFPRLLLKMQENEKKTCPFVTRDGCTIYEDRPGACRIYPVGRASITVQDQEAAREKFFMIQEEHCLGFQEDRQWSVEEWMAGEGLDDYNKMNDRWMQILTSPKSLGSEKDVHRKLKMFFMASYNLDRFRDFIFKSSFLRLFSLENSLIEALASDDVTLMCFGFQWLRFSLFGEKTMKMASETR